LARLSHPKSINPLPLSGAITVGLIMIFLWEIRGIIDKLIGGVGLKRGQRDACDLRTGDCVYFWKVVNLKVNERLLLFAQMKLSKAWLEFKINENQLIQSTYFYPKGV